MTNDFNDSLQDVFVRDLQEGTTTLVSVATNETSGNNSSHSPMISADGCYVVFQSYASNLVSGRTNTTGDIFVRNLQAGTTTLVASPPMESVVLAHRTNP